MHDELIRRLNETKTMSIVGMCKNAGKTTTLKSVVGILQFDQGEITIDGKSIKANPLGCKREMAYIPDNPDLYDYMTGIKYLNFIADVFGVDAQTRQPPPPPPACSPHSAPLPAASIIR